MCGIAALVAPTTVRESMEYALLSLVNRGEGGHGVAVLTDNGELVIRKDEGMYNLQSELFDSQVDGHIGLAQTRWATNQALDSTVGDKERTQPFGIKDAGIGLVHNGQVENMSALRSLVESWGVSPENDSDSELILYCVDHFFAEASGTAVEKVEEAVKKTQEVVVGGYSCLAAIKDVGVVGFRSPHHIRPLTWGAHGNRFGFASEDLVTKKLIESDDVQPLAVGQAILATNDYTYHEFGVGSRGEHGCLVEPFYFQRRDSLWGSITVKQWRYDYSTKLASLVEGLGIRVVCGLQNTGPDFGRGIADALGAEYLQFVATPADFKHRIFISPARDRFERARRKFPVDLQMLIDHFGTSDFSKIPLLIADDSIIRGTNMKATMTNLYEAARNHKVTLGDVYVISALPMYRHACHYGMDTWSNRLAEGRPSVDEMATYFGVKKVFFPSVEQMQQFMPDDSTKYCMACLTGVYPTQEFPYVQTDIPVVS